MAIIDIPSSDNFPDAPAAYAIAYSMRCMVDVMADLDIAQKDPFKTRFETLKLFIDYLCHDLQNANVVPF